MVSDRIVARRTRCQVRQSINSLGEARRGNSFGKGLYLGKVNQWYVGNTRRAIGEVNY